MIFAGSHVLSIDQFERDDIERIFSVADLMEPYAQRKKLTKVLDGAILGSMFFEPSTRTRVSFGCAFNSISELMMALSLVMVCLWPLAPVMPCPGID